MKIIVEYLRLQTLLDVAKTLVDECKLRCNDGHLRITAADPANVGMLDATLDAAGCESYEADGEVLGINLSKFDDYLGFADAGDLICVELNTVTNKLDIEYDGFEASLALIDPGSIRQEPDVPDLELVASARIYGHRLERGVKGADLASDHIYLVADLEGESFHAEANGDTDDVDIQLHSDDLMVDVDESAKSLFSTDYCLDLIKPIESETEVIVKVGEEQPTKWWYELHDGDIAATYMLAPRIQSD